MKKCLIAVFMAAFSLTSWAGNTVVSKCNQLETGFSPEKGAEDLVIKTIDAAQSDVKMMAYLLTSPDVVQALIRARKHGTVEVIADESQMHDKWGLAALSTLANAGVYVRTIAVYRIMHDKVIIVDGKHVEFGSFNYTRFAATSNSENANTCWNSPDFAAIYTRHWKSRWDQGNDFKIGNGF